MAYIVLALETPISLGEVARSKTGQEFRRIWNLRNAYEDNLFQMKTRTSIRLFSASL